jgi:conjugative transposon TraM protein
MKHSQKFLQKRKFMMVLPLLVLPFITMIFWALGGGQASPAQAAVVEKAGLNLSLPSAHFNEGEELNKLKAYEQAERDSAKFQEAMESDPYFDFASLVQQEVQQTPEKKKENSSQLQGIQSTTTRRQKQTTDPNEIRVNQKLEQLYKELNKEQEPIIEPKEKEVVKRNTSDPQFSSDVKQLENMMEMMNKGDKADPEMERINGMMEKILDIQHPERVRERIKEQSSQKKGQVFSVDASQREDNISMLNATKEIGSVRMDSAALLSKVFSVQAAQNSFYGLNDENAEDQQAGNAIEAVVHDTQELVAGSTVKMRLLSDVYINGKLIEKDQFVYGTAAINGERMTVAINSIREDNSLFPVSLSVYDLDGLEGIYIPGAITRDVAKQSSDQAIQSMQFMSMDQSVSAQAASAGLQAAKGLFSKKMKLIRVTVKAGYKILLKDQKDNQS